MPRDRVRMLVATGGGTLQLDCSAPAGSTSSRLWCGSLCTPIALGERLHEYDAPIRYRYASAPWPLSAYRTEYADTPGSAEMPSAGRPLTKSCAEGRRVIAVGTTVVGTTVVRALESAGAAGGAGSGWTDLVVTPQRGVTMVEGQVHPRLVTPNGGPAETGSAAVLSCINHLPCPSR